MKIRYIGEDRETLKHGTTCEVLGVEKGWFRRQDRGRKE